MLVVGPEGVMAGVGAAVIASGVAAMADPDDSSLAGHSHTDNKLQGLHIQQCRIVAHSQF